MSRRENLLDPAVQSEAHAIDAALRGERGPEGMDELESLVAEVRAQRPVPREDFARELDRRVAAGFQPPDRTARSWRWLRAAARLRGRGPRVLVPVAGAVASLLIVLVVAVGVLQQPGRRDGPMSARPGGQGAAPAAPEIAQEPMPRAGGGTRPSYVPPIPPPGGETLPGRRDRRVERQASLALVADPERVDQVSDGVIRVTDRAGGIVARSTVENDDDGRGSATFDLRVPTARLGQALSELSRLAHVRARTQSFQDVTAGYVGTQERLREALAQRSSLLRQLARADTAREAESVRARLAIVNSQIAGVRAELSRARERTGFASIAVTVEPEGRDSGPYRAPSRDWTPREALADALRIFEVAAAVAIVAAAALVPLLLAGAALWLIGARVRRARRERALNGD